jgi:hypothetical protein
MALIHETHSSCTRKAQKATQMGQALTEARNHLLAALHLLNEAGAPSQIRARLEHAIEQFD